MKTESLTLTEKYKESLVRLFDIESISPVSKYLETDGPVKKVHYLEPGSGKPLILIHGGGGNNSHWYNLIKPLQERFQLFVIDRPGCGLTDEFNYSGADMIQHPVSFIKSFMDAAGIDKASFLSNSMGGYFTIRFASEFPERTDKIVLPGAPAGLDNTMPFALRLLGVKGLNTLLMKIAKPSLEGIKSAFGQMITPNPDKLPDELYECCYLGGLLPGAELAWKTLLECVTTLGGKGFQKVYDISEAVTMIRNPTLFIWGEKDVFAPPSVGEKVVSQMENAAIKVIQNAGHHPWWDAPGKCSELIIDFLTD